MNQYALMNSGYGVKKNIRLGFSIPAIGLSKGAKQKLRWMDYYQEQHNAAKTCRYFGISRKTFHKWLKRYNPKDLYTLEEKSRRPERYRTSKKQREYGAAITALRAERPTWSKYKIGAFIRHGGAEISDTTVGDILRRKGLIDRKSSRKRRRAMKRNTGKIRVRDVEIAINQPGALVQIDTKEYRPAGERKYIQFTAVDCFSRKRVLRGYGNKTARNGAQFLAETIAAFPFKIMVIETDNGSEFKATFDEACRKKKIMHVWAEPSSPNQNAYVESSHSIDQKEFYEQALIPNGLDGFRLALRKWEHDYNAVRPHGSLKFLTPDKFLESVKI